MKSILRGMLTLLLCFGISSTTILAQGFYLRLTPGYATTVAGQTMDGTGSPYSGTISITVSGPANYSIKTASFGSGGYLTGAAGYMINEHVGIDAAFSIGVAPKKYTLNYNDVVTGNYNSFVQQATSPKFFIPSLLLQTGGDQFKGYARFGIVVPLNTQITSEQIYNSTVDTLLTDLTYQIKNKFSLGLAAAVGLQYHLSDNVKLTAEVSILSLSALIKQADLVKVVQNGVEYSVASISDTAVTKHYTYGTTTNNVTYSSTNQPAYTQPFSNVGFNVGVIFAIGRQGEGNGKKKKGKEHNGYFHH